MKLRILLCLSFLLVTLGATRDGTEAQPAYATSIAQSSETDYSQEDWYNVAYFEVLGKSGEWIESANGPAQVLRPAHPAGETVWLTSLLTGEITEHFISGGGEIVMYAGWTMVNPFHVNTLIIEEGGQSEDGSLAGLAFDCLFEVDVADITHTEWGGGCWKNTIWTTCSWKKCCSIDTAATCTVAFDLVGGGYQDSAASCGSDFCVSSCSGTICGFWD